MSAVTALLLALAVVSVALGAAHAVMWSGARGETAQRSAAIAFLSLAGNLAISAFIDVDSRPRVWSPALFIACMACTASATWFGTRSAYEVLDLEIRSWRRAGLVALAVSQIAVVVERSIAVLTWPAGAEPPTLSAVMRSSPPWVQIPFWSIVAALAISLVLDAWQALRARGGLAWLIGGVGLAVGAVVVARIGAVHIPYLAVVGALYALVMFGRLVVLAQRGLRGADPLSGLDRYRTLHRLGAGGMGEAWLAVRSGERGFHRLVVVKHMHASAGVEASVALDRFLAEARLAARLDHPGIVSVFDVGRSAGGWYIVMEYLSGVTLAELVARARTDGEPLPHELVSEVAIQLAGALAHAHDAGVVHRDVSPDNVILTLDGVAKVIDFGIARSIHGPAEPPGAGDSSGPVTRTGAVIGKEAYMAPERLQGQPGTPASDIFALSVVLFELLTLGRPSLGAELSRHPALDQLLAGADAFAGVLRRGLAERSEDRFASGIELARALRAMRGASPPIADWIRQRFPDRVERERALRAMTDPSVAAVASAFAASPPPAAKTAVTVPA